MPFETIQQMIDICQVLDALQGISMPRNYVNANVMRGKATMIISPNRIQHARIVLCKSLTLISFCHANILLLLDTSIVLFLFDDDFRYTSVYTIKNKSDVVDVLKKFYGDAAIIRSKHPLYCFHRDNTGKKFQLMC